jgi:hypothetical protein
MAGSPLLFDFDFVNLIISGKTSGSYEAENDLYSDAKELIIADTTGLSAGVPPPFLEAIEGTRKVGGSVGGNPISATQNIAPYFFINNIDGWRLRPPEEDGETTITGNLFPLDPDTPFIIPTVGNFTQLLRLIVSPQAIVDTSGGALTAQQHLWLKEIHALTAGDAVVSLDDLTVTIYDTNVSPRVVLAVYSISLDERTRTRIV